MQDARITLHSSQQRMQVRVDGILLVETIKSTNTLELHETRLPATPLFPT
ncbi:hypothetical protein LG301_11450 [Vreelandella venusta]